MRNKKILLFIAGSLGSLIVHAQQTHTIHLDGKGRVYADLPAKLYKGDKVNFHVYDPDEKADAYTGQFRENLVKAQAQLTKLLADAEKLDLLKKIYGIDKADVTNVHTEIQKVITTPATDPATLTYLPNFGATIPFYHAAIKNAAGIQKTDFNFNTVSSDLVVQLPAFQQEAALAVLKYDLYKKLVFDWLQKTKGLVNSSVNWQQIRADQKMLEVQLSPHLPAIQAFATDSRRYIEQRLGRWTNADIPKLKEVAQKATQYTNLINSALGNISASTDLRAYKNWVLKWLWMQNSVLPALNPLPFRAPEDLGEEPDTSMLSSYREGIRAREAILREMDMKKFTVAHMDTLIRQVDSIRRLSRQLENAHKTYVERKINNEKARASFTATSKELNNALLVVSENNIQTLWMRHHDASKNNSLMGSNVEEEYLESDRVVIITHNLLPNQSSTIKLSFQDISNDQTKLSEALAGVLGQLQPVIGKITVPAAQVNLSPKDQALKAVDDAITNLAIAVENARGQIAAFNYLATQHTPFVDVKEVADKSSAYHSEVVNPSRKVTGPKKATYYLNTNTTELGGGTPAASTTAEKPVADTFSYRVNKLYRIFPMAGITYSFTPFNQVSIDSASGQSKTTSQQRVRFIVGVKVFLRKTDIRNSSFILSKDHLGRNLFLSRTSLNVAFDVTSPLANIYTGAGFDIWPGFSLNFGSVFNRYNFRQYSGGVLQQEKTLYRPGFYAGVSTDVVLFAEILKLLNLSK